ncbi:hypothetical protein ACFE04_022989 [Oxalis oulophora]
MLLNTRNSGYGPIKTQLPLTAGHEKMFMTQTHCFFTFLLGHEKGLCALQVDAFWHSYWILSPLLPAYINVYWSSGVKMQKKMTLVRSSIVLREIMLNTRNSGYGPNKTELPLTACLIDDMVDKDHLKQSYLSVILSSVTTSYQAAMDFSWTYCIKTNKGTIWPTHNNLYKVGPTEDTTNALIAYALHLTNRYACFLQSKDDVRLLQYRDTLEILIDVQLSIYEKFRTRLKSVKHETSKLQEKAIIPFMKNRDWKQCRLKKAEAHIESTRLLAFTSMFNISSCLLVLNMLAVALAFAQKFTLLRTYSVYDPVLLLMVNLNKQRAISSGSRAISSGSQGNDRHAYVKGGRGFVCPASRCFLTFLLDTQSTVA